MKTLIFGFSRPLTWKPFAEAIMWMDESNISHGFTEFESQRWDVGFIYQNSGHRTNFEGSVYFKTINQIVEKYAVEVSDEVEAKIGKLCVDREGVPYGLLQIFGKGLVCAVFLLSYGYKRIKNPFSDGGKTTDCIEEVGVILSKGLGVEIPLDMDSTTVKPFRDFVASLPMVKRIV